MTRDEYLFGHDAPVSLTIGQLPAVLADFPADAPLSVSFPDEPGSTAFAEYLVGSADPATEREGGVEPPADVCDHNAGCPADDYCLPEGDPR